MNFLEIVGALTLSVGGVFLVYYTCYLAWDTSSSLAHYIIVPRKQFAPWFSGGIVIGADGYDMEPEELARQDLMIKRLGVLLFIPSIPIGLIATVVGGFEYLREKIQ